METPPEPGSGPVEPLDLGAEKEPLLPFPVVGIGASAGGLAAFETFFSHLPQGAEQEMAFVLIQHLSPDHKSLLADLLQRITPVPVVTAEDGAAVQAGRIYVIPPNQDLSIAQAKLRLSQPLTSHGLRLPIDFFFRSLAKEQGELAVGIILSGAGSDGSQGLRSIKEAGGLAIAQTPESAEYDGMPRSALATRQVDLVLPPDQMPYHLLDFARQAFRPGRTPIAQEGDQSQNILEEIFLLLLRQAGIDFSPYKHSMTTRRIERRMAIHLVRSLRDYLAFLQQSPAEVEALVADLLIGVTSFFRNPEAFELLQNRVIPQIVKNHPGPDPIRVWAPGCSTGEEAYSLAILFREYLDQPPQQVKIQIFATDVDPKAIAIARRSVYPENIALDLSAERLDRFFMHEDGRYVVRKNIREMVVFAEHNLLDAPPFTRLDLVCCRNLLIYLNARVQKKLIPLFRYALQDNGFLFLGSAEGVGPYRDLFLAIDRKWKLYQARGGSFSRTQHFDFTTPSLARTALPALKGEESESFKTGGRELIEKFLLKEFAPPCVVINEQMDILYVHGHTRDYLEQPQGEASHNLIRMALPALRTDLTTLIRKAAAQKTPARRAGVRFRTNGDLRTVNLAVYPVENPEALQGLQFVVFQDGGQAQPIVGEAGLVEEALPAGLEHETWGKEDYLQVVVDELESANQELKSKNEEMQAMYEELQSSNEEMETAREELQSVNEELNTVNVELQSKLDELSLAGSDMKNLLAATGIATLFLDRRLHIMRYTPTAARIIKMIPGDIGRPVGDIVSNLNYDVLQEDIESVLATLASKEVEVQDNKGAWYLVRILPYRTLENVIEGVVITFVDISEQKRAQAEINALAQKAQEEREFAESIVATVREPLLVVDQSLAIISANRAFYRFFQVSPAETIGLALPAISREHWKAPELLELLQEIQAGNTSLEDYALDVNLSEVGKRRLFLNARKLVRAEGQEQLILLAFGTADHLPKNEPPASPDAASPDAGSPDADHRSS